MPLWRRRVLSWVRAAVREREARYVWAYAHSWSRVRMQRTPLPLVCGRGPREAVGEAMLRYHDGVTAVHPPLSVSRPAMRMTWPAQNAMARARKLAAVRPVSSASTSPQPTRAQSSMATRTYS